MPESGITELLRAWTGGDSESLDALAPLVYDHLHRRAEKLFRDERADHTLQPTALVHEVFAKLVDADVTWQDRAHFYALAARMMRRLLINHAKARHADKRGGDAVKLSLDESLVGGSDPDADLFALHQALSQLAELDPRKAELIELQYFGGLSFQEMEQVTALSSSTLDRELRFARAWIKDRLSPD